MIRKYILIAFFGLLFVGELYAQNKKRQGRTHAEEIGVYLDNGSILIGKLIKETDSDIKLYIDRGGEILLNKEDIKRVKRASDGYSFTSSGRYNYDKGFYASLYPLALYYGSSWPGDGPLFSGAGSQVIVGRHHNARLSYGLMLGISNTDSYDEDTSHTYWFTAVPTVVLVNYNINLHGPRVYVTSKAGYTHILHRSKWDEDIELGAYGAIGVGIAIPSRYLPRMTIEIERVFIQTSGLTGSSSTSGGVTTIETFSKVANYTTFKFGIALRQ